MHRPASALVAALGVALAACGGDEAALTPSDLAPPASSTAASEATTPDAPIETAPPTTKGTEPDVPTTPADGTEPPVETSPPATDPPATDPPPEEPPVTEPTDPPTPAEPVLDGRPLVDRAMTDLRERLGDPAAAVTVVSVDEVEWPDGSIGCPQPDMVYTQAIVNGTKIVLQHGGVNYDYHQGGPRDLFYCPPTVNK